MASISTLDPVATIVRRESGEYTVIAANRTDSFDVDAGSELEAELNTLLGDDSDSDSDDE